MLIPIEIESEDQLIALLDDGLIQFVDDATETSVTFYPENMSIVLSTQGNAQQFDKDTLDEFRNIAKYFYRFRKNDNKDAHRFTVMKKT